MADKKITDIFSLVPKQNNKSSSVDPAIPSPSQSLSEAATPLDNSSIKELPYRPPKAFIFPKTKVGDRSRSCQHQWFEKFAWLHYDTK